MEHAADRHLVISSDCHAGLPPERYRDYVDPQYRDIFDIALPIQAEEVKKAEKKFLIDEVNAAWRKGRERDLQGAWDHETRIRILDAEIGDFRRDKPGIPLRTFDVTVNDLVIDVARPLASIRPALMQQLTIGEFTLEEKGLNEALTRMGRTLNLLRVHFQDETVRIEYLGRPVAEVMMRLPISSMSWGAPLTRSVNWHCPMVEQGRRETDRISNTPSVASRRMSLAATEMTSSRYCAWATMPSGGPDE